MKTNQKIQALLSAKNNFIVYFFLSLTLMGCHSSFETLSSEIPENDDHISSGLLDIESPLQGSSTNKLDQDINGVCPANAAISISGDIANAPVTTPCSNQGQFAATLQLSSSDGEKNVTLKIANSGSKVASVSRTIYLDRVAPAAATLTAPSSGSSTTNSSVTLRGSCEASSLVQISGDVVGSPLSVNCSNGLFSLNAQISGSYGSKNLSLTQRDRAGNISAATNATLSYASTPSAPGAPTITSPVASAYLGSRAVTVSGSCQSGHTVNLNGQITVAPTLATCTSGNRFTQSVTLTSGDGTKTISATQSNSGGISSAVSVNVTLDTTAPAAPTVSSPASGSTVSAAALTLQGACESAASVRISGDITTSPTVVTCANSSFSTNINLSSGNGSKAISLTQSDRAGHSSPARNITLTLNTNTSTPSNPNWSPRNSVRVLLSGHSLLDNPLPDFLAATANGKSDSHLWNQQNIPGSPLRVRTQGNGNWGGYREGKNRSSSDLNIINEVRNPQTLGAGQRYDTLVVTERHDILSVIEWENTMGYLRHYHDLMISGNSATRTFFYHSWWDINKSNPSQWITHEKNAQFTWECVASKVNASLGSAGRSDRIRLLPSGGALVDLVEKVMNNQVNGISGSTVDKMNRIFRDSVHLTDLGNYYMSLVVYSSIYGKSASGSFPDSSLGISNSIATQLQTIAWNFVNSYYTQSTNPAARTMASCRAFTASNTCQSWHGIRNESGQANQCASFWGGSTSNNPFSDSPLSTLAPAW